MFFLLYRDQFLDILYDHADLDCNAFVRSKAVQILLSLVKAQALPIKRYVNSFLTSFYSANDVVSVLHFGINGKYVMICKIVFYAHFFGGFPFLFRYRYFLISQHFVFAVSR